MEYEEEEDKVIDELLKEESEEEFEFEHKESSTKEKGVDAGKTLTIRVSQSALLHTRRNKPLAVFSKVIREGIDKMPSHLLEENKKVNGLEETLRELNDITKRINIEAKSEGKYTFTKENLKVLINIENAEIEKLKKENNTLPKNDQNKRIKIRLSEEQKEILTKIKNNNKLYFQDIANAILLDFDFNNLNNYKQSKNIYIEYSRGSRNIEQIISNIDALRNNEKDLGIIKKHLALALDKLNKIKDGE